MRRIIDRFTRTYDNFEPERFQVEKVSWLYHMLYKLWNLCRLKCSL